MTKRDRRSDIMRAAEKLFTGLRYHEISLDDVVREARVGKGTIYRYFTDKDDLFLQTATGGFDELCKLLSEEVPPDASFTEQLVSACRNIGGFFDRRRQLFRMMQSEEARMFWCRGEMRQRWVMHNTKLVSAVARIIRKGVQEGQIRGDIDPEMLATFLLGMLRTRARGLAELPEASRGFELVVDLFINGVSLNGVRTAP
jgi:AcrR family transcriptional regulator